MSPTGLQKTIDGAEPRAMTREGIREWYVERGLAWAPFPPHEAALLIRRLVDALREPERGVLMVLEAVSTAYQNEGTPPP